MGTRSSSACVSPKRDRGRLPGGRRDGRDQPGLGISRADGPSERDDLDRSTRTRVSSGGNSLGGQRALRKQAGDQAPWKRHAIVETDILERTDQTVDPCTFWCAIFFSSWWYWSRHWLDNVHAGRKIPLAIYGFLPALPRNLQLGRAALVFQREFPRHVRRSCALCLIHAMMRYAFSVCRLPRPL